MIPIKTSQRKIDDRPPLPAALDRRGRRGYFVVRDHDGQRLAYVHFDNPTAAAKPLTRDEARRIASNIAKLPELLRKT